MNSKEHKSQQTLVWEDGGGRANTQTSKLKIEVLVMSFTRKMDDFIRKMQ